MTISVLNGKPNYKLDNPSKSSTTISIKKSPTSDPSSLLGDFEEISLSNPNSFSRDSISDSLRDSFSTTISSSPYFSDVSSTKSGDSSNEDDGEISTANTSATSTNSIDLEAQKEPYKLHKLSPDSFSYRSFGRERERNNHNNQKPLQLTSTNSTKQQQLQHQLSPTSPSSMSNNRPLTDDYSFVHKRLARQRSIGGTLHKSISSDVMINTVRRASTGTSTGKSSSTQQTKQPSPPSPRRSTPLLRKALSSSHLQNGLGIYPTGVTPLTKSNSKSHPATINNSSIKPKLKPLRTNRISSDELELQYDHDEEVDYDLPDNALMWNVPLSPALYAKSKQTSQVNSIPSTEPLNIIPRKHRSSHTSPDINTLPSIQESEPVLYSSSGLENLSKDAQDLTIALTQSPNYNDIDRRASGSSRGSITSSGQSSRRQSLRRVSSTSSFNETNSELNQYSLSSKTRPNGLPPKTLNEEQKHLKEFSKILEQAALADKKRISKRESQLKAREKQRQKDEIEWKNILPNLSSLGKKDSSLIRELWWRGIPSKYREQVWKQQIGNKLNISNEIYTQCLSEASRTLTPQIHQAIASDTRSTFSELQIFGENGPLHNDLVNIIKAYAVYRPKVGYKSSITSMTAILLLNMSTPLEAFIALANMLENSLTMALLIGDDRTVTSYYTSFLKVLHTKLSPLYRHFQEIQLPPSAYLEPMLSSQFTEHLSLDTVHRIWDVLVFEGDAFLLRVALGVILSIEHRLYTSSTEIISELGWSRKSKIDVGEEDSFMQTVRDSLKA